LAEVGRSESFVAGREKGGGLANGLKNGGGGGRRRKKG